MTCIRSHSERRRRQKSSYSRTRGDRRSVEFLEPRNTFPSFLSHSNPTRKQCVIRDCITETTRTPCHRYFSVELIRSLFFSFFSLPVERKTMRKEGMPCRAGRELESIWNETDRTDGNVPNGVTSDRGQSRRRTYREDQLGSWPVWPSMAWPIPDGT